MKYKYFVYLISIFFFIGCKQRQENNYGFDTEIYNPEYSSGFSINSDKDSLNVIINIYNPWQGAENISSKFLISNNNVSSPVQHDQWIKGEAKRIVCMSSTHVAMLDALGAVDLIVGVSGKQYISNPYIKEHEDEIVDIGYEGNIDYEKLLALRPDIVLLFSINGASSMEPKLKELGIPFIYIGDYLEEDPLGKTEWIIPIAELIGRREMGINKFNEIVNYYNALKDSVANNCKNKPKVMLNAPLGDSWFMPSTKSYVAQMMKDAGAEYIYTKNTGNTSKPIDMEEAFSLVSKADFWLNIGTMNSQEEVKANFPKFSKENCIVNKNLYNNNFRSTSGGGNDCYESGVVNPHIILRDLIKIFHPELVKEEFVYYQHLE